MSGFSLLPVDGGDPIPLPPGETVLGRGPLLRVNDKRVSRHHGLLENLDGRLRLKPTHLNPCFVRSSLTDDPRPLQKDTWHPLHHGDLFSLLPGQFVYKVVAPSQSFEEEEDLPVSPEPDVKPTPAIRQNREQTPPCEEATLAALSNEEEEEEEADSPNRKLKEAENDQRDVAPPAPKRRVLPAWMMAAVAAPHTSSSSSPKAVKRRKEPAAASTSTKRAAARQATTSSPEGAELSEEEEEEMPKKKRRRRKMSDEEEAKSKTDVPSPAVGLQSEPDKTQEKSDNESDNFAMEVEEEGRGGETSAADRSSTTRTSDAGGSKNNKTKNGQTTSKKAKNGGSASKLGLRTACPYGKDCYRKNPVHFQECSHPGDTDYEEEEEKEEEEEEEADRPECPYGTDCYRKNPLHRKEYKHTKRPARTTRTVPKSSPADDDDDFEDDDDDGFINDDSEDAGDDSDYAPPDSDDSGKEDIKRLQREAKTFLKRKK
ncbi:aprataxin and PNK-like factor isoform X1 [Thunnus albacares]|uniref:aprataxin and PNK-like factor isoform X1 n=1 Tax=Thunnus albacares TaxID=8236 RepID=UPI001CF6BFC6|nr:aprataxin and PNK-like factor isoform X1 [Thunnus albacares]